MLNEASILEALKGVKYPGYSRDIVSFGLVKQAAAASGAVSVAIELTSPNAEMAVQIKTECERALRALPGVSAVHVEVKAAPGTAPRSAFAQQQKIPGIARVVAVASGKGGVGKSTCSVNLACTLAQLGLRVGLLDCDIYGPSIPRMMALSGRPETADGKTMIPMENYGVRVMSIGFLVDEDTPMIWRGPMVMGAIEQMLRDVRWGELDVLVCDLPPGTGDAQLTMAQRVPLSGAVIVSTPQDIALLDAVRGINMFRKVDVPVLGLIENMSYFVCPHCGGRSEIFHHGGAKATAAKLGVEFLGEIPLDIEIRTTSDEGRPIVAANPTGAHAKAYLAIAGRVLDVLKGGTANRKPPRISFV